MSLPAVVVIFQRPPMNREKASIGWDEDAEGPAFVDGVLGALPCWGWQPRIVAMAAAVQSKKKAFTVIPPVTHQGTPHAERIELHAV
ncbi:MAG: hypothetical protein ACKVW3_10880 [Phycisphaerales bacterium]